MKGLHVVAFILIVVGGLNWLLLGLFGWDISQLVGGMNAPLAKALYIIIGLAAILELINHKKQCKLC